MREVDEVHVPPRWREILEEVRRQPGSRSRLLPRSLPLHGHLPEEEDAWAGLMVGLLDREGFLHRLGVAEGLDRGRLRVRARPYHAPEVASVEVGTGRTDIG